MGFFNELLGIDSWIYDINHKKNKQNKKKVELIINYGKYYELLAIDSWILLIYHG